MTSCRHRRRIARVRGWIAWGGHLFLVLFFFRRRLCVGLPPPGCAGVFSIDGSDVPIILTPYYDLYDKGQMRGHCLENTKFYSSFFSGKLLKHIFFYLARLCSTLSCFVARHCLSWQMHACHYIRSKPWVT